MTILDSKTKSNHKVLIIAYDFHPFIGGGGAIRMIKLARNLNSKGCEVHVLTGGFESKDPDDSYDTELQGVDIHIANPNPAETHALGQNHQPWHLRAAGRVLRSILPFPDNRFRFLPKIYKAAKAIIESKNPQSVIITIPPNSMGLLTPMLRWAFKDLNIVLDVRDMWALDPLLTPDTRWFRWLQKHLERWAVSKATHIVCVTEGYRDWFKKQLGKNCRITVIHNGYDERDFQFEVLKPDDSLIKIGYAGSLGGINGPRTIKHLSLAVKGLIGKRADIAGKLKFLFIGNAGPAEREIITGNGLDLYFEFAGFLKHDETLKRLSSCNILLLNHFNLPYCDIIFPGKLYEYLKLAKPILTLSPPGLLPDFINNNRLGEVAAFDQVNEIKTALETICDRYDSADYKISAGRFENFERGKQALRYLELLEQLP
jgi:glycosyltransferase involved in cell wall biosynthesis